MVAIARFSLVALDTPDPLGLAGFYAAITGWPIQGEPDDTDDWIELASPAGATLTFQLAPGPRAARVAERRAPPAAPPRLRRP